MSIADEYTTRADEIAPRSPQEAAALGFFVTLMNRDLDAFEQLWTEDAVQEHPFPFPGLSNAMVGRDEIVDDYRRMFANRSDHVFLVAGVHRTEDPDVVIIETRGTSLVGETGKTYDQRYIALFRLRDGKIALNRFYCNPLISQEAFAGVLIGEGISVQR